RQSGQRGRCRGRDRRTVSEAAELSPAKRLLLERLLSGESAQTGRKIDGVKPRGGATPPPISLEQEHVWLHASMAGDRPLYNEPITIHRHGSFDLALLEESFNDIVRRHEIWRTAFVLADGAIRQIVHEELRIAIPLVDLSHLPEAEREAEALRLATA